MKKKKEEEHAERKKGEKKERPEEKEEPGALADGKRSSWLFGGMRTGWGSVWDHVVGKKTSARVVPEISLVFVGITSRPGADQDAIGERNFFRSSRSLVDSRRHQTW